MTSSNLIHKAGHSKLVLWDNPEGWDGVGGEKEAQEGGDICILTADSHCCMAETKTNIVKQLPSN